MVQESPAWCHGTRIPSVVPCTRIPSMVQWYKNPQQGAMVQESPAWCHGTRNQRGAMYKKPAWCHGTRIPSVVPCTRKQRSAMYKKHAWCHVTREPHLVRLLSATARWPSILMQRTGPTAGRLLVTASSSMMTAGHVVT